MASSVLSASRPGFGSVVLTATAAGSYWDAGASVWDAGASAWDSAITAMIVGVGVVGQSMTAPPPVISQRQYSVTVNT